MSCPNLADGLDESVHVIGPGGRVLVLAYHSLEDRMVKETFGRWAGDDAARDVPAKLPVRPPRPNALVRVLTRKPMRPSADEIAANPRAESARLRAVERLPHITPRSRHRGLSAPMSAQPSPRPRPAPNATPRPGSPNRGDGARARLTVAPEVARRRLRARLSMWGAALVTVASLFTLVAFHVFAAQSAFTLERLSKERTNEQLRYERLREQVARLSSANVVIDASNKLGMVQGPGVVDAARSRRRTPAGTPRGASPAAVVDRRATTRRSQPSARRPDVTARRPPTRTPPAVRPVAVAVRAPAPRRCAARC